MTTMHGRRPATRTLTAVVTPVAFPSGPDSDVQGWRGLRERVAKRLGTQYISKILDQREVVRKALNTVPERMQKLTNQARLMLELVDDFRAQRYCAVPWHSIAIAAGALLYAASPGDVVPDLVPGAGLLDDLIVFSVAMRLMRGDLKAYLRFKGYDAARYF